jgi:putative DNA primase/helicase
MPSAEIIAKALGGKRAGTSWIAHCPAHEDRAPSLSITAADDGKVLVCCHAHCEQVQVISALRARGLWDTASTDRATALGGGNRWLADAERSRAERTEAALAIWNNASPAPGTPVQDYLGERRLHLPIPPSLRFHPGLKHPSGGRWPAMVALVTRGDDGMPVAIHRTFLARGSADKAPVTPAKMMLGPCSGGAVRLGSSGGRSLVGEGIETCLAAMQASGYPAWAALSTSGLRSLDLPVGMNDIVILADGDDAGEAAARDCAVRWKGQGRRARIARPPWGCDFNDLLLGRGPVDTESAL